MRIKLIWTLLIVYALASGLWGSGWVVCYGADGHVALEPAHVEESCCGTHSTQDEALLYDAMGHDCEPCLDIPLQLDGHLAAQPAENCMFSPLLLWLPIKSAGKAALVFAKPGPPPRPDITRLRLRTVFLQI